MKHSLANHHKQSGLSIIELMIAVTIGLFLLTGIATSYITSVKSSSNRDQSSMLEDNARLALDVITKSLEHTGYANGLTIENRFVEKRATIIEESCGSGFKNVLDQDIFPKKSTFDFVDADGVATGDSITTVYLGDNRLNTDCAGGVLVSDCRLASGVTENARIYNSFFLAKDANDSLLCAGSQQTEEQVVAEGIENIQILYGVDSGAAAGTDLKIDRFVNARELFAKGLESSVVSIQVALLVRSLLPVNTKAESKKFKLLDVEYTSATDRYRREVFTTTIRLRNTL